MRFSFEFESWTDLAITLAVSLAVYGFIRACRPQDPLSRGLGCARELHLERNSDIRRLL
jgi:hypothetical protein